MLARRIEALPSRVVDRRLRFEPKWDGWRALLVVDQSGRVGLWSRRGSVLTRGFPEVVAAGTGHLPAGTVLDGELVCWWQGRLDFGGLQARNGISAARAAELAVTQPVHYIAFDVLRSAGTDRVDEPLAARRAELERLFRQIPGSSPLALGMHTESLGQARVWFDSLAPLGVEGIVIKPAASRYLPGQRGWDSVKHFASTEFLIGGVTGTLQRPEQLQLGRYVSETGELRLVGRTVPLHAADARTVAALIRPAGPGHPWPDRLPGGWQQPRDVDYVRVDPTVVVEVRVDTAAQAGRWRHGLRFLRTRPDLEPEDVPFDLNLTT